MKLEITTEQARDILDGDETLYKIIEDKIVGKSRWSIPHRIVIQRITDGKFFVGSYRVGATEEQHESPWEFDSPDFYEAIPIEKTIVEYKVMS